MNIQNYGKISSGREKKFTRKIKGIIIALIIIFAGAAVIGILTDNGTEYQERYSAIKENHELKELVTQLQNDNSALESRVAELEGLITEKDAYISSMPSEAPSEEPIETEQSENDWTQASPRSE